MTLRSRASALVAAFRGNPLENPAVPLSSGAPWLFDLFGGAPTDAGVRVNTHTAMQLATVYSCVNGIASDLSSLTLKAYVEDETGKRPAVDSDLYYLLAVQPNPDMTAATFWASVHGSALIAGNGYAEIQWSDRKPVALWPRDPRRVKARRAIGWERLSDGSTALLGDLIFDVSDTGPARAVPASSMLHIPAFSMDGIVGLSPIHAARQTIGTAIAAEKFGAGFFGRGSRPSGLLTGPVDERDPVKRSSARESWEKANSGENQGRTAVLPGGWTWTQIGISPDDAQFLQTQEYSRGQICAIFRYPAHLAGDTSRLSNGNHESIALEYIKFTLRPWLVRVEQECLRKLVPKLGRSAGKVSLSYDLTDLERADFAAQLTAFATGTQWGFLTRNEIRRQLGLNPVPGGDVFYMPLNMIPTGPDGLPLEADVQDASGGGDQEPEPKGNGGQNQRMLLDRMVNAYSGLFTDAAGRLMSRSKRDAAAIAQIFDPVLNAIAQEAKRQACSTFRVQPDADLGAEKILRDVRKALEKRVAEWKVETSTADAQAELLRTVRAITLGVFREAGSSVALAA